MAKTDEILLVEARLKDFMTKEMKRVERVVGGSSKKISSDMKRMDGAMGGLGQTAKGLFGAYLGFQGARMLGNFSKKAIDAAGAVEGLSRAFANLGASVGISRSSLEALREATDGTVSDVQLLTKANNALILGIVESEDQLAGLFDTAQRLGQAMGIDTTRALDSMVTGLGRQSRLMLDNLGIIVDSAHAYNQLAKTLGVTAESLTDEQKKVAFLNEAMRISTRATDQLGKEQLDAKSAGQQLDATWENLVATVGDKLTPGFEAMAKQLGFVLGIFRDILKVDTEAQIERIETQLAALNKQVDDEVKKLPEGTKEIADGMERAFGKHTAQAWIGGSSEELVNLRTQISMLEADLKDLKKSSAKGEDKKGQTDFLGDPKLIEDELNEQRGLRKHSLEELQQMSQDDWMKRQEFLEMTLREELDEMEKFNASLVKDADDTSKEMDAVYEAMGAGLGSALVAGLMGEEDAFKQGLKSLLTTGLMAGLQLALAGVPGGAFLGGLFGGGGSQVIGAFAHGRPGGRGGRALVGERGPEIVDIPEGAKVRSAGETSQIMNNTTNNTTNSPMTVVVVQQSNLSAELEQLSRTRGIDLKRIMAMQGINV